MDDMSKDSEGCMMKIKIASDTDGLINWTASESNFKSKSEDEGHDATVTMPILSHS